MILATKADHFFKQTMGLQISSQFSIIIPPNILAKKEYRKLSSKLKEIAEKKEKVFRKNPFDSQLKTHKLSGRLEEFWAFSLNYQYRIIFEFRDTDTIWFHSVGTHDIYR